MREQIIDAAERLMVDAGDVESVSMRSIATSVGVTPPAIYMHFEDKDELFQAICDRRFEQLNAVFDEAISSAGDDPVDRLLRCGRAYIRFGVENPEAYRFMMLTKNADDFDHAVTTEEPTQGDIAFLKLVSMIAACLEAGAIRPMDPLEASLILWSTVHGLTTLMITSPQYAWPPDIVDKALETSFLGLAPRD